MRLVCGSPVRLPRTDAPLTSGYPYAWEPPVSDTVYRWDCTVQWLRSNPPYVYTKQPAPVVRAALPRHVGCRALRVAWRLCSAVPVQQSPRSAGPSSIRSRAAAGPGAGAEAWYRTTAKLERVPQVYSTLHTLREISPQSPLDTDTPPPPGCVFSTKEQTRTLGRGPSRFDEPRGSYLVDPASSHMLVSKIKPCMSKYKHLYRETADGSLKQLSVYLMVPLLLGYP